MGEVLRTNYTWVNGTEVDKLANKTKKAEKWLNDKIEEQDEKTLLETPAFFSYEVYYKIEPIVESAKKLLSRPKPYGWEKVIKSATKSKKEKNKETDDEQDEKNKEEDADKESDDEQKEEEKSEDAENEKNEESDNKDEEEKEVEMVARKRTHRIELKSQRFRPEDVGSMNSADFASSAKILLELDERDRSVVETADARNELESYIFESRNRLYEEKNVQKVTTEDERTDFLKVLEESEDWIWDVEDENAGVYKGKIRELKKTGNAMFLRADEIDARPAAIDAAGKTLSNLLESVEVLRTNYTWVNGTEVDKLANKTKKAEKWL